jgi:hypothetical protein
MIKCINTKFKKIHLYDDYVVSIHFIKKEFDSLSKLKFKKSIEHFKIFKANGNYDSYYNLTIEAYKKASVLDSNFKIVDFDEFVNSLSSINDLYFQKEDVIITSTTKYGENLIDLFCEEKINFYDIKDSLIDLIKKQKRLNLYHLDFAFRNICVSINPNDKELHLIDFDNGFEQSIKNTKSANLWLDMLFNEVCLVCSEDKNMSVYDILEMFRDASDLPNWEPV